MFTVTHPMYNLEQVMVKPVGKDGTAESPRTISPSARWQMQGAFGNPKLGGWHVGRPCSLPPLQPPVAGDRKRLARERLLNTFLPSVCAVTL